MTAGSYMQSPPPPPLPLQRRSTGGGIALVVLGGLAALLSLGLLAGGGVLMYADRALRDASGYLASPTAQLFAPDYAIAATDISVVIPDPSWHVSVGALGSVRVAATSGSSAGVFLGIAPSADVQGYLSGVAYDQPTGWLGTHGTLEYQSHAGGAPATAPGEETFWAAQASGTGTQTVTWKVESGKWAIVLMNADASKGVAAAVSIAASAPFLFGVALALLIGGGVLVVAAILGLVFGIRLFRPGAPSQPVGSGPPTWHGLATSPPPVGVGGLSYPVRFDGRRDWPPGR